MNFLNNMLRFLSRCFFPQPEVEIISQPGSMAEQEIEQKTDCNPDPVSQNVQTFLVGTFPGFHSLLQLVELAALHKGIDLLVGLNVVFFVQLIQFPMVLVAR